MTNRIRPRPATQAAVRGPGALAPHSWHPGCTCFIVPPSVFDRFSKDKKLTPEQRQYFADAGKLEQQWRSARVQMANLANLARTVLPTAVTAVAAAAPPSVLVFDCQHGTTLPGTPVANPGTSADGSAKR